MFVAPRVLGVIGGIGLVLSTCSGPTTGEPVPRATLTVDDYAVYSVVLAHFLERPPRPPMRVILRDHALACRDWTGALGNARVSGVTDAGASNTAIADFLAQEPASIDTERIPAPEGVELVPEARSEPAQRESLRAALAQALSDAERQDIESQYAYGFGGLSSVSLSRIGFDARREEAVVTYELFCGPLCGAGSVIRLQKENGVWKFANVVETWVS